MLSPAFLACADILVAERAAIGLGNRLPWRTCQSWGMFIIYLCANAFFTSLALLVILFFDAFFQQVSIESWNFNDLATSIAICQHQARDDVMQVKLLRIMECFLSSPTKLARRVLWLSSLSLVWWWSLQCRIAFLVMTLWLLVTPIVRCLAQFSTFMITPLYELLHLWNPPPERLQSLRSRHTHYALDSLKTKLVINRHQNILAHLSNRAVLMT